MAYGTVSVMSSMTPLTPDMFGLRQMASILATLRGDAVHGAVSMESFNQATAELHLDPTARERLVQELGKLGLRIAEPQAAPVVPVLSERIQQTLTLVQLCAADGAITRERLERVAVQAGLTAEERSALPAAVQETGIEVRATERPTTVLQPAAQQTAQPAPAMAIIPRLDAAVAAAMQVIHKDRFRLRPEKELLTAEEEVGLWVLLRGGPDSLDDEPADDVFAALPSGDIRRLARDTFIRHNLGLVHSVAQSHVELGLEYDDLVQHGMLGLMHAICKFDGHRGLKFSTYAMWWIKQAMSRAIADEGAIIRIPVYMHDTMRVVAKTERLLRSAGKSATAAQVAVDCGLNVTKVDEVRKLSRVTDSLDREIVEGVTLGEALSVDNPTPGPEEALRHVLARQIVDELLAPLPAREADVLRRRIGLVNGEIETLDSIGVDYGVTRERIRQLEGRGLMYLRRKAPLPHWWPVGRIRPPEDESTDEA